MFLTSPNRTYKRQVKYKEREHIIYLPVYIIPEPIKFIIFFKKITHVLSILLHLFIKF
jgi:hypothetical protein